VDFASSLRNTAGGLLALWIIGPPDLNLVRLLGQVHDVRAGILRPITRTCMHFASGSHAAASDQADHSTDPIGVAFSANQPHPKAGLAVVLR